jgi:hypothetical protein
MRSALPLPPRIFVTIYHDGKILDNSHGKAILISAAIRQQKKATPTPLSKQCIYSYRGRK